MSSDAASSESLLVLIVDLNLSWWGEQSEKVQSKRNARQSAAAQQQSAAPDAEKLSAAADKMSSSLQALEMLEHCPPEHAEERLQLPVVTLWRYICGFLKAFVAMRARNQVAVIAAYGQRSRFLYPDASIHVSERELHCSSTPEQISVVEATIREALKRLTASLSDSDVRQLKETTVAGALGRAICYSRRAQRAVAARHDGSSSSLHNTLSCRAVILSSGRETQSQYLDFINAVFSAQKMSIPIDALVADATTDSVMLQQAADLSGGSYHKLRQLSDLLAVLLCAFIVDPQERDKLFVLRRFVPIDYRAACFCHGRLIDRGFVCSICLSVFCQFQPRCTTCRAQFKFWKSAGPTQSSSAAAAEQDVNEKRAGAKRRRMDDETAEVLS